MAYLNENWDEADQEGVYRDGDVLCKCCGTWFDPASSGLNVDYCSHYCYQLDTYNG